VIILILIPVWVLAWVGISVLACPYLGFVHGSHAIDCAVVVVGGGGVALPVVAGGALVLYKNRQRRNR